MALCVSCRNLAIWHDITLTALFGTIPIPFCCSAPRYTLGPAHIHNTTSTAQVMKISKLRFYKAMWQFMRLNLETLQKTELKNRTWEKYSYAATGENNMRPLVLYHTRCLIMNTVEPLNNESIGTAKFFIIWRFSLLRGTNLLKSMQIVH